MYLMQNLSMKMKHQPASVKLHHVMCQENATKLSLSTRMNNNDNSNNKSNNPQERLIQIYTKACTKVHNNCTNKTNFSHPYEPL